MLSPKSGPSGLQKQPHRKSSKKKADHANYVPLIEHDNATDDQSPRRTVPVISITSTKANKVARYKMLTTIYNATNH